MILLMCAQVVGSLPDIEKALHKSPLTEGDRAIYRPQYSTIFVKMGVTDAQSDSVTTVIRIPYLEGLATSDTLFSCDSLSPLIRGQGEIQQLCQEMTRHIQVNDQMRALMAEQIQTVLGINRIDETTSQTEQTLVHAAGKIFKLRANHNNVHLLGPVPLPNITAQPKAKRHVENSIEPTTSIDSTVQSETVQTEPFTVSSETTTKSFKILWLEALKTRLGVLKSLKRQKRIVGFGAGMGIGYYEGKKIGEQDREWFRQYDEFYRAVLTSHKKAILKLEAADHQIIMVLNDTQAVAEANAAKVTNATQYIDYLYYRMDQILEQLNDRSLTEQRKAQWQTLFLGYLSKTILTAQTRNVQYLMYLSYCRQLIQTIEQASTDRTISKFLFSDQAATDLLNDVTQYLASNMPEYKISERCAERNFFSRNKIVKTVKVTDVGYEIYVNIPVSIYKETMTLYRVKSYEMPVTSTHDRRGYHTTKIHLESDYLAISRNNSFYAIAAERDIRTCEKGLYDYWDCPFTHVVYSTKVPSCTLALFLDDWLSIRMKCNPELIVRTSPLPLVVENIFDQTYLVIIYAKRAQAHWDMQCPDTGSYKYDACESVCLIHMKCRCKLVIPPAKGQGINLLTIGPSIQECTGGTLVAHLQGRLLRFQNRIFSAMIDERRLLANESHDWNSPWLSKVPPQHDISLDRPVFTLSNTSSVHIKRFSFSEVQKEVDSKFDPNEYYGKDTPPMNDYGRRTHVWFNVIIGVTLFIGLLMTICCIYCCCGHWIAQRCCPAPGGGPAGPPTEGMEMQSRRRYVREDPDSDEERDRRGLRRTRRIPERYLDEDSLEAAEGLPRRGSRRAQATGDYRTVYVQPGASTSAEAVAGEKRLIVRLREPGEKIAIPTPCRPPPNVTMTPEMDENRPEQTPNPSSSRRHARASSSTSRGQYSIAATVGSLAILAPVQTQAFTVDHPLNQQSPLPDRTMFVFVLNLCGLVIALLIIVKHGYQLALNARRIRYKASTFLRRVFHINVKTSAKIYLEISNYRDCAYLPLVELAIPPKDLYYLKPFVDEPKCTLHLSWCRSYMRVRWRSSGVLVKSPQHADLYIRLPKSILIPGASKYTLMDILNGPYVIHLIMRHANTFCERIPVLSGDTGTGSPVNLLSSYQTGTRQEYLALADADEKLKHYVMNLSSTSGHSGLKVNVKKRDPDPV